jgi:hypothetical protein
MPLYQAFQGIVLLSGSNKISSKEIAVMNFNKFLKNIKK